MTFTSQDLMHKQDRLEGLIFHDVSDTQYHGLNTKANGTMQDGTQAILTVWDKDNMGVYLASLSNISNAKVTFEFMDGFDLNTVAAILVDRFKRVP